MRKCVSVCLVFACMHCQMGCSKWVIDTNPNTDKSNIDISVETVDSTVYVFTAETYKFENDTLQGYGQKITRSYLISDPSMMKIPMENIVQIKTKKADVIASLIAAIAVGATIAGIYYLVRVIIFYHGLDYSVF